MSSLPATAFSLHLFTPVLVVLLAIAGLSLVHRVAMTRKVTVATVSAAPVFHPGVEASLRTFRLAAARRAAPAPALALALAPADSASMTLRIKRVYLDDEDLFEC